MRMSYEEQVKGRTVIDASGRSVGEVDALYLDADSIPERADGEPRALAS